MINLYYCSMLLPKIGRPYLEQAIFKLYKNKVKVLGDKFAFFFFCTKKIANHSSQPRLCSFLLPQFESSLLNEHRTDVGTGKLDPT